MRNYSTIHPFVPILILFVTVELAVGWEPPAFALTETETPEPTLRDLIKSKAKEKQAAKRAAAENADGVPVDPLGRGVPRSSVRGFLAAAKSRDYARASEYLDLRNLPEEATPAHELARQLKIVFDRVLWIDLELLSTNPEGDSEDNLPATRDRVGRIEVEDGKAYEILLQRVPRGDDVYIWKFSSSTVAEIPELYREFGYGPLERIFPAWLFDITVLGIHLWVWVAFILLGVALYPVAMLITRSIVYLIRRFRPDVAETIAHLLSGPVTVLLWTVLVRNVGHALGPSVAVRALEQARTVQVIALAWLLIRLIDFGLHRLGLSFDRKGLAGARVLLAPVANLLKFLALTAAILLWLDNIGFKVTTLLAGLSISGVAVALASQKSIENIFGALTLYTARPVKVGDFCRFGGSMGTVEEIGLRATRIRTLERSVISIANAEFVSMHLDNLSARDRFWFHPLLQLRYETTSDQLRYILIEVRKMLYAHPKVLGEPLHVRFKGFGEYSLDIEVFSYIGVTDYTESLEVAEDLNFRIMDIVAEAGTDLAFPAAIEYQLPGKPHDEERARVVAAQVKEWKAKRAMYLPNFPKEKIAEVKGSLDYPPEGSPQYTGRSA
jgi:MscS family membrane protein